MTIVIYKHFKLINDIEAIYEFNMYITGIALLITSLIEKQKDFVTYGRSYDKYVTVNKLIRI